jgi:hypothetical protein
LLQLEHLVDDALGLDFARVEVLDGLSYFFLSGPIHIHHSLETEERRRGEEETHETCASRKTTQ